MLNVVLNCLSSRPRRGTWKSFSAFVMVMVAALISLALATPSAMAQAKPANAIDDTWQGTLHLPGGKDLRIVLKIAKAADGSLSSNFYSIDQNGAPIAVTKTTFQGGELDLVVERIDGKYMGKMAADGKSIVGTWTQGPNPLPLLLERATPATEWTIPEPPKPTPAMAADAKPVFDVATIKPAKPDEQGMGFQVRDGGRFRTINTTLVDLITFAYDVQQKQVVGAPVWADTDKYDIAAQPDIAGMPNPVQLKSMVKKMLADRFGLKFHGDEREMSAYVLAVGKGGAAGVKLKKADSDGNLPGLFFRGLGDLTVQNATMPDFCSLMQSAVLDRPVVDHTALAGRWDFKLKWTPDETQFGGMGIKVPPPTEAADAPPPLFTAIQEQLGLKLEATKTQVKTMVVDHVEKPSDN